MCTIDTSATVSGNNLAVPATVLGLLLIVCPVSVCSSDRLMSV